MFWSDPPSLQSSYQLPDKGSSLAVGERAIGIGSVVENLGTAAKLEFVTYLDVMISHRFVNVVRNLVEGPR